MTFVGVHLRNKGNVPKNELIAFVRRDCLRKGSHTNGDGLLPLTVMMPCGFYYVFGDVSFLPFANSPCPCGNPDHLLTKYEVI